MPDCSNIGYDGDGTTMTPYEVTNVSQLQCMGNASTNTSLSENFEQASDIDATETSGWNSGAGFEPIGDGLSEFTGTFDGSGFTVTGLYINRSRSGFNGTGLFGVTGAGALIEAVGLENANVNNPSNRRVGGLVGLNVGGTIESSYVTGNVSGTFVGGLVGFNSGTVDSSYATANVSGNEGVGGLVGFNNAGATVRESYATGDVSGNNEDVGGLVGENDGGRSTPDGNVTESYWDTESTGQSTSDGNGTGLTTSEMTGSAPPSNMTGFDFTSTWETVTNPDDYPILVWQEESALFTQPLPGFNNPPTNTQEIDNTFYEDISGDGDGTDPTQAVTLWTQLVINEQGFDDLTQEQIDALDWNGDGQLTPADAVSLWTEQVLAG